jgi:hypothetical protein
MTISKVFMICNAYKYGYVHGLEQDKLCNPFISKTDEYEAYNLGYHEGFGNRQDAKKDDFCTDDKVKLLQYDNLRKHFQKMIRNVLGEDYYNMGMDVYDCDRLCCEDIARKAKSSL